MAKVVSYKADYANLELNCRYCNFYIEQGELKIVIRFQTVHGEMLEFNCHGNCLFRYYYPSILEIENFDLLRKDDQEEILKAIDFNKHDRIKEFGLEYSKSNKAECRSCNNKIMKGVVRIYHYNFIFNEQILKIRTYFHFDCFIKNRYDLLDFESADQLSGFQELNTIDQNNVKDAIELDKK